MEISKGIETKGGSKKTHVLNLLKNIYGVRQGYRLWNQYLTKSLEEIIFRQSKVSDCVLYRRRVIFIDYVDDGIFDSPSNA